MGSLNQGSGKESEPLRFISRPKSRPGTPDKIAVTHVDNNEKSTQNPATRKLVIGNANQNADNRQGDGIFPLPSRAKEKANR